MNANQVADGSNDKSGRPRPIRTAARALTALTGLALFAPLLLHAYLGAFSRPLADDFCTWGWLNELGYWGSQVYWYQNWSGRFSFSALMTASHYLGPALPRLLPGLLLGLWAITAAWAVWPLIVRRTTGQRVLSAGVIAGALIGGVLGMAPNLYQTLYWHTGSFTYLVPIILFTGYAGWILRPGSGESGPDAAERIARFEIAAAAVVPFIAAGFSETFALLQIYLLVATAVTLRFLNHRRSGRAALFGLAGAALGSLLVALAPGNASRAGLLPGPDPIFEVAQRSVRDAYIFGTQMVHNQLSVLLMVGLAVMAVGWGQRVARSLPGWFAAAAIALVPLLAFLGVVVIMLPSEYALSSYPDGRVLVNGTFVVSVAILLWGWTIVNVLSPRLHEAQGLRTGIGLALSVAALAMGVVYGASAMEYDLNLLPDARQYASAWDSRHRNVIAERRAGNFDITAASLSHMGGLAEISRDSKEWINRCFAQTYGLDSVEAK